MSVINTLRDLESLLVDIRTRDLSDADIGRIADAVPTELLSRAWLRRRLMPGAASDADHQIATLTQLVAAWTKAPELRLGQLIKGAIMSAEALGQQLFYLSDESLIDLIERHVGTRYTSPKQ